MRRNNIRTMDPAERLLDHLDRIAGSQPRFVRVSPEGAVPRPGTLMDPDRAAFVPGATR